MKWIIGDYGDIMGTKEFGDCNGVIYVDISENVLKKTIELIDNESVEVVGMKARKFVEKYTWEDIVADFESVLEEVT